ncbi:MAG: cob(I)yrinic acid a,c-diamide adenosyltransferase [Ruminococcus sp.]|nr:cob(I)yrinic acid a,c-diamide adenosyltransferase [Ruminococcus sp.]
MGLIHVYCGDGKGKTTCALGLALRAAGAEMNVVIIQFLKGSDTSELLSLRNIPQICVLRNTQDYGFVNSMTPQQLEEVKQMHNSNLENALSLIETGKCDLLILDELTYVYDMKLIDTEKINELIQNKPEKLELVITGRNPSSVIMDNADYITEMKAIRHPFDKGVCARKGIEF